jgi:hypothetical protein
MVQRAAATMEIERYLGQRLLSPTGVVLREDAALQCRLRRRGQN